MNPILTITVEGTKASCAGTISVGEKIDVSVSGLGSLDIPFLDEDQTKPSLRLRIVDEGGHDVARFPLESTDAWTVSSGIYSASSVNLNTFALRKMFDGVAYGDRLQFGVIIDSAIDYAQYARGKTYVQQWSMSSADDPKVLPDWTEVLAKLETDLATVSGSKATAIESASAAVSAKNAASSYSSQAGASALTANAASQSATAKANAAAQSASAASEKAAEASTSASNSETYKNQASYYADSASAAADRAASVLSASVKKSGDTMTGTLAVPSVTLNGSDLAGLISAAEASAESAAQAMVSEEAENRENADEVLSTTMAEEVQDRKDADLALAAGISTERARAEGAESTLTSNLASEVSRATGAEAELRQLISGELKMLVVDTLPATGVEKTIYLVPASTSAEGNVKDEYLWVNNAWEKIGSTSVDLSGYARLTNDVDVYVKENSVTETEDNTYARLLIYAKLPNGIYGLNGKIPESRCKFLVDTLLDSAPSVFKYKTVDNYLEIRSAYTETTEEYGGNVGSCSISGKFSDVFSVKEDGITVDSICSYFGGVINFAGGIYNTSGWVVAGFGIGYSDDGSELGYYSVNCNYLADGTIRKTFVKHADISGKLGKNETAADSSKLGGVAASDYALSADVPSVVSPSSSAAEGAAAGAKATGTALAGKVSLIGDTMTGPLRVDCDESTDTGADIRKEGYSIVKDGDTVFAATDGGNVLATGDVTVNGKVVVGENDYDDGTMYGNGTITRESENGETVINLPDDGQSHDFPTKTSELTNDSGFVTAAFVPTRVKNDADTERIDGSGNVYPVVNQYDGGTWTAVGTLSGTGTINLTFTNCTKVGNNYQWTNPDDSSMKLWVEPNGVLYWYYVRGGYRGISTGATNPNPFNGYSFGTRTDSTVTLKHVNTNRTPTEQEATDRLARESQLPYPLNETGTILDRRINVVTSGAFTIPENFTDLVIRYTGVIASVTFTGGETALGDSFVTDSADWLVTVTKTKTGEAFIKTLKMEARS